MILDTLAPEHTHSRDCPRCPGPHGGAGPCDQFSYSVSWLKFIERHWEAYEASLYDGAGAGANERARLDREYAAVQRTPRHVCLCNPFHCASCADFQPWCARCGEMTWLSRPHRCDDCDRLRATPARAEIGRTRPVHAPAPDSGLVDVVTGYALSSARRRVA